MIAIGRKPGAGPEPGPPDAQSEGSAEERALAQDATRFLGRLEQELREVRREFAVLAALRLERARLSLSESLLGLLGGLVGLGAGLTLAVLGALALARGLHGGLLELTVRPWLAQVLEGLLLLGAVSAAWALLRWRLGRRALRRIARRREASGEGDAPAPPERSR